jgi:hypothetical protein
MLAITFGVLLAFGLNAWWESKQAQAFNQKNIELINAEIERNVKNLNSRYEYRVKLYPELLKFKLGQITFDEIGFQGTRPPKIEKAAYELAQSNAVFISMDPEDAQTIISIYLDFDRIEDTHRVYANSIPQLLLETSEGNEERMAEILRTAFMDFMFAEGETIRSIGNYQNQDYIDPVWETISQIETEVRK